MKSLPGCASGHAAERTLPYDADVADDPAACSAIVTDHLELLPLPAPVGRLVANERDAASEAIGASLHPEWPLPEVAGLLARLDDEPGPAQDGPSPSGEHFGVWVMVEQASSTVVGDVGFHGPPVEGTVEIGYAVVPDRRRRGYATEAVRALVTWSLSRPDVGTVVAQCDADNAASIRTLERCGFGRTGGDAGRIRWRHVEAARVGRAPFAG